VAVGVLSCVFVQDFLAVRDWRRREKVCKHSQPSQEHRYRIDGTEHDRHGDDVVLERLTSQD
jgi:hypothetical protein